ncbi:hypothetical protein HHL22_10175 [Hymenobacter sp. RP-2-7]|uniref:Uncharacterized protein n=1 Tax=Hymenobacter polaris TaxID=2682546 RepID=A0A7Y0AE06_9BACT|nr:hypothetical protein [Hymenobacter polaris]NML65571.1 hypothetical protein [Hymenobacter polaris]
MLTTKLLLPLLALPLLGVAQVSEMNRDQRNGYLNNGYAVAPPEASGVQGSAFLVPAWLPGTLQLNGDGAPLSAPLKYDIYHQELRAKRPAGDSVVVPLARVKEFSLTAAGPARRFVCYPAATLPAEVGGGCGEVLADGSGLQLLKFQRKEVVKRAADNGAYVSTNTVSALEEQTHYYLRWPADGHFTAVKPKRASLEQALAGQPAALAALKAHKGSLGTEAELAAAVAAVAPAVAPGK